MKELRSIKRGISFTFSEAGSFIGESVQAVKQLVKNGELMVDRRITGVYKIPGWSIRRYLLIRHKNTQYEKPKRTCLEERWFSIREAAEIADMSDSAIYKLIQAGKLNERKRVGHSYIQGKDLFRYLHKDTSKGVIGGEIDDL